MGQAGLGVQGRWGVQGLGFVGFVGFRVDGCAAYTRGLGVQDHEGRSGVSREYEDCVHGQFHLSVSFRVYIHPLAFVAGKMPKA